MGLGKWWLTHGPGSPGSVAKTLAESYSFHKRNNPSASEQQILLAVLASRAAACELIGSSGPNMIDAERLITESRNSLSKLILKIMHYEDPLITETVIKHPETYRTILEIIDEMVAKYAPAANQLPEAEQLETEEREEEGEMEESGEFDEESGKTEEINEMQQLKLFEENTQRSATISISRKEVELGDTKPLRRLLSSFMPDFSETHRNRICIGVGGYNGDPRALYDIPEVRIYFQKLFKEEPSLFYWIDINSYMFVFLGLMLYTPVRFDNKVTMSAKDWEDYLLRGFMGLNKFCDSHGVSPEPTNRAIKRLAKKWVGD